MSAATLAFVGLLAVAQVCIGPGMTRVYRRVVHDEITRAQQARPRVRHMG